jgi:hypothetical protein
MRKIKFDSEEGRLEINEAVRLIAGLVEKFAWMTWTLT